MGGQDLPLQRSAADATAQQRRQKAHGEQSGLKVMPWNRKRGKATLFYVEETKKLDKFEVLCFVMRPRAPFPAHFRRPL